MYRDLRELLVRHGYRRGDHRHRTELACGGRHPAAEAGKDVYCEKPCTKNIAQSLALAETFRRTGRVFQAGTQRRSLPNFAFGSNWPDAANSANSRRCMRIPADWTQTSGWLPAEPEPDKEVIDWDLFLGPAAWRPFNKQWLDAFNFEKGGGLVGGGCLEWGSHCVDICQWANDTDKTTAVEFWPEGNELHARYANGVKLILRNDGWLKLGSCPVRFEGETGWVETGDNGEVVAEPSTLIAGPRRAIAGYPANFHVRDFLACVRTRGLTRANAEVACWSHITCHAANIALFLNRKVTFDPVKNEFIGDEEANRLRSEAQREPWRV